MSSFRTFIINDFKLIFRDKTLMIMFFLPVIFLIICRYPIPILTTYFPETKEYYWLIQASFCILSGSTPAFLTAFIMLDEKDEQLISVLKITPMPFSKIISFRVLFLMLISFVFTLMFLTLNELSSPTFSAIILTSILTSFVPAILLLFILPLARNKIEGVTLFKGINMILFIPIAAFFVSPEWKNFFGILPFYWIYELLNNSDGAIFYSFVFGLLINGGFLFLLILYFNKRFIKRINY